MDRYGNRIQSVDRAIMILKCFSQERPELKLTEISEKLDLNKSTVHGLISTLKYHGLISQDEETQKYRLGLYLMELGDIVKDSMDIRGIARPIIDEVCKEVGETVHLGTLDGEEIVYIDKKESHQSIRIYTTIGTRNPAYCTGLGKAMLAYSDSDLLVDRIPEFLQPLTSNTITSKKKLFEELRNIKEKGYSIDNEENLEGLICVAAPIFDYTKKAKYAISVAGPTVRMSEEKINKTINIIKDAAKKISYRLGYKE